MGRTGVVQAASGRCGSILPAGGARPLAGPGLAGQMTLAATRMAARAVAPGVEAAR